MEDLAASLMSHSHSAPLYLLYDVSSLTKHVSAPPVRQYDDGFEFATAASWDHGSGGGGGAALRACASDVSADELFRAGVLLPLRLPPRLQRPARSTGPASAATSPTCRSTKHQHRGFDPFAAALEKVRRDGGAAPAPGRSRSLSPLRRSFTAAAAASARSTKKDSDPRAPAAQKASTAVAAGPPAWRARKGVKQLLFRAVVAPKALLRPRRKDSVSYGPGLLVCFGF